MGSSTSTALINTVQVPLDLAADLGLDGVLTPTQTVLQNNTAYDYIVIGAGTAGCAVTSRLVTNSSDTDVLLLEAGPDPLLAAYFSGLFFLLQSSINDFNYTSAFDPYGSEGGGNYTKITSGTTLGGSSAINHLLHTRGSYKDYEYWANVTGDESWTYNNTLKYFIKSETVNDEEVLAAHPDYHGTEGPIGLTTERWSALDKYLEAFAEAGNPKVLDINSNIEVGYVQPLYTINNKIRQSTGYSYVYKIKDSSNLHYSKETRVTRIEFNGTKAVAVEAIKDGQTYIFRANKEIILTAGPYNSAQLLMLSGIGPKEHLESLNIDVKADLPVGNNLKDQAGVHLVYKTKKALIPITSAGILAALNPTQVPFPVMVGAVALNKTQTVNPDYQTFCLLFFHDTPFLTLACHNVFGIRSEICDNFQEAVTGRDHLYCILANIKPESSGTVRLKSTDPFEDPEITLNYYNNTKDLENVLLYMKDFIKVGNSSFFTEVDAELVGLDVDVDSCEEDESTCDEELKSYALDTTGSVYHAFGTCALGSVVDGSLKLIGFEGLRVADASVIPIMSGAPNAAVIMIAEKAADMILSGS